MEDSPQIADSAKSILDSGHSRNKLRPSCKNWRRTIVALIRVKMGASAWTCSIVSSVNAPITGRLIFKCKFEKSVHWSSLSSSLLSSQGPTCGADVNECARFAGTDLGCQNGATCANTPGGYNCICASGMANLFNNSQVSSSMAFKPLRIPRHSLHRTEYELCHQRLSIVWPWHVHSEGRHLRLYLRSRVDQERNLSRVHHRRQ